MDPPRTLLAALFRSEYRQNCIYFLSKFISEMVEFGKVSSKSDTRRKNAIGITQIFFVGVLTLISFLLCIYNSIKLN